MKFWKYLSVFVFLVGSVALSGCGSSEASSADAAVEPAVKALIPVGVKRVNRGDIFARHNGTSVLEADFEAPVVAKVEGDLVEILIEEGDTVKAGQVLARLDGERLKLAMERVGSSLASSPTMWSLGWPGPEVMGSPGGLCTTQKAGSS